MLDKFLYRQIDIAALVFFRIAFGVLGLLDVFGVWVHYHLMRDTFNPDNIQIKYYGFEWVQTLPDPWLSIVFWIVIVAALGIIVGKWYRFSTIIFALGFSYIYFLEKCNYLNHGYFFSVLSYLMILLPANRAFALDLKTEPSLYRKTIDRWVILIPQFMMAIVYIFGGLAKINADWLRALPLRIWLPYKKDYFIIGPIFEQEWLPWFMSYGGVLHDLLIIPFMLIKRTREAAFLICCFFHISNTLVFQIGIFPWLSIATTALFFAPDFPRHIVKFLQERLQIIKKWHKQYLEFLRGHQLHLKAYVSGQESKPLITLFLFVFFAIQICIPLRPYIYNSEVAWTEEGHRYSWRMMLRGKLGKGYFMVKDLSSDKSKKVYARKYLTKKQNRKFKSHPDMLLFVAHHIRDRYQEEWESDSIAVYPHFKVSLNGRNYQQFTDIEVDLAQEEWSWTKQWSWILPLDKNDFPEKYKIGDISRKDTIQ